jgi:large conductance mechanosensitive channel
MSFFQEFKTFAIKGNMVDLAIGVIIGAAFGKVVSSFVGDVIMPPIGLLLGGVNFSDLAITLKDATATHPAVKMAYGTFLNTLIDFLIIAFTVFIVIKVMNRLRAGQPVAPTTKECPECLMTIAIGAKKCPHCCTPLINEKPI